MVLRMQQVGSRARLCLALPRAVWLLLLLAMARRDLFFKLISEDTSCLFCVFFNKTRRVLLLAS